jgi:four helix bundle protein
MWQRASELLQQTVEDIESFPKRTGCLRISDQLFRSVSSISANIAEGFGKRTKREFAQACVIARGEVDESRNWYFQCRNLNLLTESVVEERTKLLMELRKMISSFIAQLH